LTPTLPPSPPVLSNEWTQHGQNAQRTSYAPLAVPTPWKWKWTWNGPDNPYVNPGSGKQSYNNKIRIPKNVQPVTGSGRVYIAAGVNGVYAISLDNGSQLWNSRPGGSINSTAAYDRETDSVFVVSSNGNLYKLNASTGSVSGNFSSGSTSQLWLPPAIVGNKVFFSMGRNVYAIDKNTMSRIWSYDAGSAVQTPPSYSATRDIVIAVSEDLYVHAIKNADGSRFWRVKPTHSSLVPGDPKSSPSNNFANPSYGWPVIADLSGIVFIRYELDWQTLWTTTWPTTNEEMRRFLLNHPDEQPLYALNLNDGSTAFIPNVGNGGFGDGGILPMGPLPAIRRLPNNKEVAYIIIRGELPTVSDGRGDSKFGELIIDSLTVPGYQPGYVRFIEYNKYGNWDRYYREWKQNTADMPTDEQPQITVAGDQILGGHWMAGKSLKIVDRSADYGSFAKPILSMPLPHIVTSTTSRVTDGCIFSISHYCSATILVQEAGRPFAGPGFYIYYGDYGNSGDNSGNAIYDIFWSEYASWIVSENTIIFRSTDGALFALVNGNPMSKNKQNFSDNIAGVSEKNDFSTKSVLYRIKADEAHKYIGKEVIIEGIISNTFDNGKAFYIDLGTRNQNGFVVKMLNKKKHFGSNFTDKFVVGKNITVVGQIGVYQKNPVLYISDPNQIIVKN
jgi:outer membrane protein assembly factor BamB